MRIARKCVIAIFVTALSLATTALAQDHHVITGGSAGHLKIGMKLADAQKEMKDYTFKRTSDGEGIALIAVMKGEETYFTVYTGEEDPEAKIDFSLPIQQIEVWSSKYKTDKGIGVDSLISDAEKSYGKLKEIMMSEIESREYAEFETMPRGLDFRVQGSGIYPEMSRKTTNYRKGAKITSIVVTGNGLADNVGFFSDYTDLGEQCKSSDAGEEGGHTLTVCEGYDKYSVHIGDTAKSLEMSINRDDNTPQVWLAREALDWKPEGKKLEWRFKFGEPFAVIYRASEYALDDDGTIKYPSKVNRQLLVVKGIGDYRSISGEVAANLKDANVKAREIADKAFTAIQREKLEKYKVLDMKDFNALIRSTKAAGAEWSTDPTTIAAALADRFAEIRKRTITMESPSSEDITEVVVTVLNEGLLDDSVAAEMDVYVLKLTNDLWQVESGKRAWKCQQNRGHQDFSAQPCL